MLRCGGGLMTDDMNEKPWESAPLPTPEQLYNCPGDGWHDGAVPADYLRWYEGKERNSGEWLCESCHFRFLRTRYGRTPEFDAAFAKMLESPSLVDEIIRRGGQA